MNDEQKQAGQQELPSTFSQLVIMIATSALQQLGQVPDPSGNRAEINLEGAQGMIDILEALNDKTKGNLDEGERKILDESLTMLRMQYVEIRKAKQPQPGADMKQEAGPDIAQPEAAPPPPPRDQDQEPVKPPEGDGESKTRYRKSYG